MPRATRNARATYSIRSYIFPRPRQNSAAEQRRGIRTYVCTRAVPVNFESGWVGIGLIRDRAGARNTELRRV